MKKAIGDILRAKKFKVTRQRLEVLLALKRYRRPVPIEEVSAKLPRVDQSTIYRILDALVKAGVVYRTDFRDGRAYYELQGHHHHHLVCQKCDRLEEIAACPLPLRDRNLSHTLEFFGLCKKCQS